MSKTFIRVVLFIIAIVFGVGMFYFWESLRPDDEFMTKVGVGIVTTLASFVAMFFLTKGSGSD
ncbi:TPA: hypothetical protein HA238_04060 [Candidatus Micrarchaeota archaeon]|nr:hypothetical protein [Candidatus Micrarchaeota archaeon]